MNLFDKGCATFSFLLGVALLLLGGFGLFLGCNANFSLPPVAGVIPAFIGWGIVRPIFIAWRDSRGMSVAAARAMSDIPPMAPMDPNRRPV